MNEVDRLIKEIVDSEVKYINLSQIGKVCMCKRILKSQTSNTGEIPFFKIGTFGSKPDAYISKELFLEYKKKYSFPKKGDILISCSGTIGRTIIFDGRDAYYQDSNIVWVDNDEKKVLNKFLYYYYQIEPWQISDGGIIKRLYNNNLERVKIPLFSLDLQKRIIDILDKFTSLKINLENELDLRKKQYEYYKQYIINNLKSKSNKHITDVALVKARVGWQRLTTAEYLKNGEICLITGTDFQTDGHINFNSCVYVTKERYDMDVNIQVHKGDILITKDGTLGKVAILEEEPKMPTTLNSGVFRIKITDENVIPKYIYYYFTSNYFKDFVETVKTGSTIPHLTQQGLVTLNIPIPTMEEQEKIIRILDKFEKLTNSLTEGLPAEIELRRKQYEYYRNKLLKFEEVAINEQ